MAHLRKVVFFGAGAFGESCLDRRSPDMEVLAVVDNDSKKWGGSIRGVEIAGPHAIGKYDWEGVVITSTSVWEIYEQLIALGVDSDKIYMGEKTGRLGGNGPQLVRRCGTIPNVKASNT